MDKIERWKQKMDEYYNSVSPEQFRVDLLNAGMNVSNRWWHEYWIGRYVFYIGLLDWDNFRIGATIGIGDTTIDLGWLTFGWMR